MTDEKHIGEEVDEILKDVEMEEELPQLPLVFTARDGETRQIGIMELLPDGSTAIPDDKGAAADGTQTR